MQSDSSKDSMLSSSPENSSQKTEIQRDESFQKKITSRQASGRSMASTPRDGIDSPDELNLKLVQNRQENEVSDATTLDVQPLSPKHTPDLTVISKMDSFQLTKSDSINQSSSPSQPVSALINTTESRPSTAPEMPKHDPLPVVVSPTPSTKVTTPRGDSVGKFPPLSVSAKVTFTPNTIQSHDGKHRAKSMFTDSNIQASISAAVEDNNSSNSKSSKMSPSEKFRTFMKSFTPSRNASVDMNGGNTEESDTTTLSTHTPEQEALILQSRIAKVQEEQLKFRTSQKHRFTLGVANQQTSFRDDLNRNNREKTKKMVKMNIHGKGSNFNGLSICAGLRRAEFRATLEQGNALLKHSKPTVTEDHFDVNSLPLSGTNITHPTTTTSTAVATAAITSQSDQHNAVATPPRQHRPVTVTGEGYMSETDWRITNSKMQAKRLRKLLGQKSVILDVQPTSYLNLDQVIEASLKEQAALTAPVEDCPDTPDVPLSYLQSAHLIERRFGWDKKDHSLSSKTDSPVQQHHSSWFTLRSALHATGNFHIISAAAAHGPAALTPQEEREAAASAAASASASAATSEKHEKASPDPDANAPIIVVEATPVTEFVAKLVQEHQHRTTTTLPNSSDEESTASPDHHKYPTYKVSTQIPRRKSPEKTATLPIAPKLQYPLVVAKEDAKTAKEKANTKEFHDRYHGLIFHDSSRNLIWQDTEDMILGTMKPAEDNILHHRSDMRWAGKTLNMFRPWSAARQEDVIDQFLHQKRPQQSPPSSPPSRPVSCPGTPGSLSAKNSPGRGTTLSRIDSGDCSIGGGSARLSRSGGGKRNAAAGGSSVNGGSTVTFSVNSKQSRSTPQARKTSASPPIQRKHHNTAHHDHDTNHHGAHYVEQSDNVSVLTNNSSVVMHYSGGSVSGNSRSTAMSRRTPLLVNIVKPVSIATTSTSTTPI